MAQNSTKFLTSSTLQDAGFAHAFFTRAGGVSVGPYWSLNFSPGVGDEPGAVQTNQHRAATALGVAAERLFYLSQVHGSVVVIVEGTEAVSAVRQREGDAVVGVPVTSQQPYAVGVRTADCVPILLADPRTRVVAAVHAGWRGVVAQVVQASVAAMSELGARSNHLIAAVGPHISVSRFEVGDEVAQRLAACAPERTVVQPIAGKNPHVDLRAIVHYQLTEAGLSEAQVDDVHGCTYSDPERFFSYRRDGKVGGRHLAAIVASSD